ncbi:MAG TPA: flagellar basal body rod protein FlgC [Devosia sp.]|nr:flagellar basal body rod protein FlgC [Devosia sp.]
MGDFTTTLKIAAGGLQAQSARMRVISENLANVDSAGRTPEEDPFRRRIPTFKAVFDREMGAYNVQLGRMAVDSSEFETRYEPGHPAANEQGFVKYPNINSLIELADMREAQRSYEANLNIIRSSRAMFGQTLDILRG